MRYMLMMHAPMGTGDYNVDGWSPQDLKAHLEFMLRPRGSPRRARPASCARGRTARRR